VNKFAKFTDLHGDCCYVNVDQIRAITTSKEGGRVRTRIVFDSGTSLEVLEALERVSWRCKNAGQADSMPATAY
jgi:hypothetical protein